MVSLSQELINLIAGKGRRVLSMLHACLDESGTHRDSPVLCVAGYIGERDQWLEFDVQRGKTLSEFGIDRFHAKEQKCDPLRGPLAELIDKCELSGIVASVNRNHYKSSSNDWLRTVMGDAYSFCALSCAIGLSEWAQEKGSGRVSLVYEHGQPNTDLVVMLNAMMHFDGSIASASFARKKQLLPLQAADFLANSYAHSDPFWFERLALAGQVTHRHVTPDKIGLLSDEVKKLFSQRRHEKKERKQRAREVK